MTAALQVAPPLRRRLACFLYEGVLLFGVTFCVAFVYSLAVNQQHALEGRYGLVAALLAVAGAYFVWLWTRTGQTLAMQTWHIRVLTNQGRPLGIARAAMRYLASWVWFAPPLLAIWKLGLAQSGGVTTVVLIGWILAYAALSRLHPRRQYWHDALCGTQLVSWRPSPPAAAKA